MKWILGVSLEQTLNALRATQLKQHRSRCDNKENPATNAV